MRVSSNRRVIGIACTPAEATALLRQIREVPGHVFWEDDISPTAPCWTPFARVVGYRQVTDAHLLSLAIRHHGRLATFDRGLTALADPENRDTLELIGAV